MPCKETQAVTQKTEEPGSHANSEMRRRGNIKCQFKCSLRELVPNIKDQDMKILETNQALIANELYEAIEIFTHERERLIAELEILGKTVEREMREPVLHVAFHRQIRLGKKV